MSLLHGSRGFDAMRSLNIWIWISKSLVDRSTPLSTAVACNAYFRGKETWCSWTTTWWCMADVLLKAHGCMRSPGSRVRCSEPLQKTSTGGITMTPAFSQALTIQELQPNGDMSLAGIWIFLADMNSSFQAMLISFAKQAAANFTIAFWAGILDRRAGHGVTAPVPGTPKSIGHAWISLKAKASWPCLCAGSWFYIVHTF